MGAARGCAGGRGCEGAEEGRPDHEGKRDLGRGRVAKKRAGLAQRVLRSAAWVGFAGCNKMDAGEEFGNVAGPGQED
jgi:hypothetical protein